MFSNTVTAKDLNGIKLYCYNDKNENLIETYTALVFIENKQVKISFMMIFRQSPVGVISQKIYKYYEVGETYKGKYSDRVVSEGEIIIDTQSTWLSYTMKLDRRTLELDSYKFGPIICEIVEYDPLEKFEILLLNFLDKIKKEKKENKI